MPDTHLIRPDPGVLNLLRQAALAGPGYRGRREALSPEQTEALLQAFEKTEESAPGYLREPIEWVTRKAKLFEVGDYPDKGVTVTEETLRHLEREFDLPVPVLVEHHESPIQLGFLTDVRAEGKDLVGEIALNPDAHGLVERSGAHSLSLGLSSDLRRILEMSLVRNPRVPSARLFTRDLATVLPEFVDWRSRFEEAERMRRHDEADRRVQAWLEEGRLVPAQAPMARALLRGEETIDFDGDAAPVRALFMALMERTAPLPLFAEMVPCPTGEAPPELEPEEAEFYRRHFGDLDLGEIARRKRNGSTNQEL